MIAVQLDQQKEFNQLWKFAKTFMWHDSGPLRGYFTWHVAYNGSMTRDDGSVIRGGSHVTRCQPTWASTARTSSSAIWTQYLHLIIQKIPTN